MDYGICFNYNTCKQRVGYVNLNRIWVLQTITKEEQQEEE